jgi:response regulator RpfG family c-di-GMP phosphodiesterase
MSHILLVDDEPNILSALRRCITGCKRDDQDPIVVETFTSATKALARMEEQDFDVVITDYRMAEMDGVEFLQRVIEINPVTRRMLMSAYADRDALVAAINDARILRFLEKPWNDEELRATIDEVLRARRKGDVRSKAAENRLEAECPGITQVERGEDGGIIIDPPN